MFEDDRIGDALPRFSAFSWGSLYKTQYTCNIISIEIEVCMAQ